MKKKPDEIEYTIFVLQDLIKELQEYKDAKGDIKIEKLTTMRPKILAASRHLDTFSNIFYNG